jgi:hypothetical protein
MGKRKMDGPNPSNPFVSEEGIEHLDGVVEYPWGTISRPLRTRREGYDAGVLDEMRRLPDSDMSKRGNRK